MTQENTLRKQPKQLRSQKRIEQILDAAAELFAEIGYEAATTNAIANRAEVAIGSLYQFFANKEAILEALTNRYIEMMRSVIVFNATSTITETISGMIDQLAAFEAEHPGFCTIFASLDESAVIRSQGIQAIDDLLAYYFPSLSPDVRHQISVMESVITKGVLPMIATPDKLPLEVVLAETKRMALAYLRAVLIREGVPLPADLR